MKKTGLASSPVIAFVATTDPPRAKRFFAVTMGLRLVSEDSFALVFDAGGTMLRVVTVQELHPAPFTVLGWIVPNIHETIVDLKQKGVSFQRYEGMGQDDDGIWTSPSGAAVAWFKDPDGNTLSLTEFEKPRTRVGSSRAVRSRLRQNRKHSGGKSR